MSLIEDKKAELKKANEILVEMEKFEKEISEVEGLIDTVEDKKKVYLEAKDLSVIGLLELKEKLSGETYSELFGSTKAGTSKKSKSCSPGSINFQVVKRFLDGENLFDIASDIYAEKFHPVSKKPESGKPRVVEGTADIDTVYLTGRHISDLFEKCPEYGRVKVGLSKKNGKIYPPVIELTEVGKEALE